LEIQKNGIPKDFGKKKKAEMGLSTITINHNKKEVRKKTIKGKKLHTTAGIRMWSPTILLTCRRVA
jgi:hypothetical protein